MHVFDDSGLFSNFSPTLKENDGKASRRIRANKILFFVFITVIILICMYFIETDDEIYKLRKKNIPGLKPKSIAQDPIQKEKEEEGRLIEFKISRLSGDPNNSTGFFVIRTRPSWSPMGVQRFEELTEQSFWDGCRFFRAIEKFIVQWGINGDPIIHKKWDSKTLKDEEVKVSNKRGTVVFAMSGKDTRTTQMYINTGRKNSYLDKEGFAPIGEVVNGMDIVDRIYTDYAGKPNQGQINHLGNKYLENQFPKLSFIDKAKFK